MAQYKSGRISRSGVRLIRPLIYNIRIVLIFDIDLTMLAQYNYRRLPKKKGVI